MYKINLISQELLFNALTADDEYSCHNWKNLPLPIQTELSKKPKIFCCILLYFWNLYLILNILKKREPQRLSISETIDSEIRGYSNT